MPIAEDGREALELFRRHRDEIRLVLLDLTVPAMGGEETFRQMRLMDRVSGCRFSSGYNKVEAIRRLTSKGVAAFIRKPPTTPRLAAGATEIPGPGAP